MGVLIIVEWIDKAPLRTLDIVHRPLISISGNLLVLVYAKSPLNVSPIPQKSYLKFQKLRTTF